MKTAHNLNNKIVRRLIPALILSLLTLTLFTSASFAALLDSGVSVKSLGMGGAYLNIQNDGSSAVFGNPANINTIQNLELSSMYSNLTEDVTYGLMGLALPTQWGNFGVGYASNRSADLIGTGLDEHGRVIPLSNFNYADDLLLVSYANKYSEGINYGARFRVEQSGTGGSVSGEGSGTAINIDLGATYAINENWNASLLVNNLIQGGVGAMHWTNGYNEALPTELSAGLSYVKDKLTVLCDYAYRTDVPSKLKVGGEYAFMPAFQLRLGASYSQLANNESALAYTAGIGSQLGNLKLDYAYVYDTYLTFNSRSYISLAIILPQHKKEPVIMISALEEPIPMAPIPTLQPEIQTTESAEPTEREYEIKWGDTLWSISNQEFGDPHLYTKLARKNRIANPSKIYVGQKIIIGINNQ
jgi:hypothetical protein